MITCWDHPREYGENWVHVVCAGGAEGSSPRIRGELEGLPYAYAQRGIIPANTGRIPIFVRARRLRRDHPREYGENNRLWWMMRMRLGSSPRIRGEWYALSGVGIPVGIIPANTGRMCHAPGPYPASTDHPREYGENGIGGRDTTDPAGSSPRIRGEFGGDAASEGGVGIIPANTGRMQLLDAESIDIQDHPREYGENRTSTFPPPTPTGSSPRIRGEWRSRDGFVDKSGIIPANTGRIEGWDCVSEVSEGIIPANTGRMQPARVRAPTVWDHPREYGENLRMIPLRHRRGGSSPRIRGESLRWTRGRNPLVGSSPRIRGEYSPGKRSCAGAGDHPREYGENDLDAVRGVLDAGSSPRIRGESQAATAAKTRLRIIPANTGRMWMLHVKNSQQRDHPREYGENT